MQQIAILLMGPTATGKSDLAISLASDYPIEIISVDSGLIYKDMNIGTAKPNANDLAKIPHYLIDIISPLDTYSVANFINDTVELIKKINERGKLPILVGGTMMYYNGLLKGLSKLPEANARIRERIEAEAEKIGWQEMHNKLSLVDPKAAAKLSLNDKQRISRALEVYYITGKPISKLQSDSRVNLAKQIKFIPLAILPENRQELHDRISLRFSRMLEIGLVQEVEQLLNKYPNLNINYPSMRSVGYYEVLQYLNGEIKSLEDLHKLGVIATRQLAKRQITWLRSMDIINIATDSLNKDSIYNNICQQINLYLNKTI